MFNKPFYIRMYTMYSLQTQHVYFTLKRRGNNRFGIYVVCLQGTFHIFCLRLTVIIVIQLFIPCFFVKLDHQQTIWTKTSSISTKKKLQKCVKYTHKVTMTPPIQNVYTLLLLRCSWQMCFELLHQDQGQVLITR